jgi:putative heme-binding domain-containing protein
LAETNLIQLRPVSSTIGKPPARLGWVLFTLAAVALPLAAQRREPDPHDVEAGSQRYLSICASCHGQDGDQVSGVDLGHNSFRRATTDQELIDIIRNGIPGTGMPANKMSESAAGAVVSYLHAMAADSTRGTSSNGDPNRGKSLFEKDGCAGCHRVGESGSRAGPDLSDIGKFRRSVDIERAILDPNAEIAPQNRSVKVVTRNGTVVTGRLLNQDTFTVLLIDESEKLRTFDRAQLSQVEINDHSSSMPSYRGRLTEQELADLISYLLRQKGPSLK